MEMAGSSLKQQVKSEDDWTKTKDPVERKRIQDRLAQRKRREKLKLASQKRSDSTTTSKTTTTALVKQTTIIPHPNNDAALTLHSLTTLRAFCRNSMVLAIVCNVVTHISEVITHGHLHKPGFHYTATDFTPKSLTPTHIQSTVPHSSVIDVIPIPSLRDKLIQVSNVINVSEFGRDMVTEGWVKIWGRESWDPEGWEIDENFLKKWWMLVDDEMLRVTNFWRRQRGERALKGGVPEVLL